MHTSLKNYWLAVFAVVFAVAAVPISKSGIAADCSTVTDDQLVNSILDDIKADSGLAPQMPHIVVGSVNRFVKLQGWTDTKRGYDRVYSIVSNTPCVAAINVNRFEETPPPADSSLRPVPSGGCAAGMKQCGDVCIPEADSCSSRIKSGS
jgi:hypothetical protein